MLTIKKIVLEYIRELRNLGHSDAYIESKAYQLFGGKVGLKFITENLKDKLRKAA